MAGYSGTPLPKKLGIKEGHKIALLGAPKSFSKTLGKLPADVVVKKDLRGKTPLDVVVLFTDEKRELEKRFAKTAKRIAKNGGLWVAWPKKSSGIETDVVESVVREHGLGCGLVDNKICAVDETWSGLRFVYRVKDR